MFPIVVYFGGEYVMNFSENEKQSSLPRPWLLRWISEEVVIGGQRSLASFWGS